MIRIKVRTRRSMLTLLTFLYRVWLNILHDIHQNEKRIFWERTRETDEDKEFKPNWLHFFAFHGHRFCEFGQISTLNSSCSWFKFLVAPATRSDLMQTLTTAHIEPSNSIQKHWRSANRSNFIYIIINNDAPPVTKRQHCIVCNAQNDKSTQTNTTKGNKSMDALRLRWIFLAFWRFPFVFQTWFFDQTSVYFRLSWILFGFKVCLW